MMFINKIRRLIAQVRRDESGSTLPLLVMGAPLVVGGLAFAMDTGLWYMARRQVQQQADTAVLGVAQAISSGTTNATTLRTLANRDANRNGAAPNSLSVNWPPVSGAYAGKTTAVEVVIERQVKSVLAQFFGVTTTTVTGRAVARTSAQSNTDGGCVLALHPTASQAMRFQGSGTVTAPSCTLVSSSNASDSVFIGGSETLQAFAVYSAGGLGTGPSAKVDIQQVFTQQSAVPADPYADLQMPATGSCTYNYYSNNSGGALSPGVYCGGISLGGSKTFTLSPGTYVMKGGDFKVGGSAIVTCPACTAGKGVTILLVAGSGGTVGTISLGGSTSVQFPAPSVDTSYGGVNLRGIAFFQDRGATAGNAATFNGSGNLKISGAIYLPKAAITYSGTSDLPAGLGCVEIIGRTVDVQGNSRLTLTDCPAMGVMPVKINGSPGLLE
jgi:Flp pilus assembly protein TadG